MEPSVDDNDVKQLTFSDYQRLALTTAKYPNVGSNYVYPLFGLAGESGEIFEKVKKVQRDNDGVFTEEKKLELKKEIGDTFWYLAALCSEFKFDMGDVATLNLQKLFSRRERDVIGGSGDNR